LSGGKKLAEERRIYAIDSDTEAERLERQAQLAEIEKHLEFIPISDASRVLDVGCGSGSMTRLLAKANPKAKIVGLDARNEYLEVARQLAEEEGLSNVEYVEGDAFSLPFDNDEFDLVWHKYLFQWLHDPKAALAEMKRVTHPGGKVVSCTFDGFMLEHYPIDTELQQFLEKVMPNLCDSYAGRKVPGMLTELGFVDIAVEIERDRLFTVVGRIEDEARRNLVVQWKAAFPYVTKIWGNEDEAATFVGRLFDYFDHEDTFSACALYFVTGTVPRE